MVNGLKITPSQEHHREQRMKRKQLLKVASAIIVLAGIAVLLIWALMPGRKEPAMEQERKRPIKIPSRISVQGGEIVLTIDADVQKKSGIVTSLLEATSHQEDLKAYGMILSFDTLVNLRDRYAAAQAQWEKTESSFKTSSKIYERRQKLLDDRAISVETFQTIENTYRGDEANFFSAREAFQMLKSHIEQQWGPVLAKWVYEESLEFNRLRFQEDVLVQVTLPSDVMIESPPDTALIETSYGTRVSAKFVVSAPRTDPRIQGQSFFYVSPAKHVGMLPGMNVVAYLPTGPHAQGVVVPDSAIVWWQGKAWVYVQKDKAQFFRHDVSVDTPVKDGWFVKKGLSPGDKIVVKGAQLLLSEEFRSQIREEG